MTVYINSSPTELPEGIDTVGLLIDHLDISRKGTGVGLNGRLVAARDWDSTQIGHDDRLLVISATYGG